VCPTLTEQFVYLIEKRQNLVGGPFRPLINSPAAIQRDAEPCCLLGIQSGPSTAQSFLQEAGKQRQDGPYDKGRSTKQPGGPVHSIDPTGCSWSNPIEKKLASVHVGLNPRASSSPDAIKAKERSH
jgi:hypothetical protein